MPGVKTISVRGAAEHNLVGIDVDLPRQALVVVTGVSGSGKSSLVFDTIGREAQRRYLETFSSYARQFLGRLARPAVRSISGLSPAIAVDQRTTLRNPRSTVGTLTGLYDDLRLLFARLGSAPAGAVLQRRLFSFNSPYGACPACSGLGVEDRLDPGLLVADPRKSIRGGALVITTPTGYLVYSQVTIDVLDQVCRAHGFDVDRPWQDLTDEQRHVVLYGSDRLRIPYGKHPLSSRLRWSGITAKPREEGVYKGILPVMEQILERTRNRNILRFVRSRPCRACGGARLRPEALAVTFRGQHIGGWASLEIDRLAAEFERLEFAPGESPVGVPIRRAVLQRAALLGRLGIGHLALDRVSTTLSGGEAQRVRLASQVGSGLSGVLYVLDEPSVGLHPSEQQRLLGVLRDLRDRGNTVLVVEHDEQTMLEADWLVDVGPGAGDQGGALLFSGTVPDFLDDRASLSLSRTRAFLAGAGRTAVPREPRPGAGVLHLAGASRNNLHDLTVDFLAGALNVVTGVSGAGKSSLVEELVERVQSGALSARPPIGKVIHIDQSPIGRTPRSNPATYTGLSDAIRDLFAARPEAVERGFGKARFSFNVAGGRCEACQGAGVQQVGMHFLGQVDVVCEACGGRRFNDETLEVRYAGLNIDEVLETTVDRASDLFAEHPGASRILASLRALGLGYLRLGQPSTTLSGGEAQRVKLAAELSRPGRGHTLYVLDEPTTGLHAADVEILLHALARLVDQGHSVVTNEHHLDVVRAADRVVELGPGSGRQGGRLVATGTPAEIAADRRSLTGAALRGEFAVPIDRARTGLATPDATAAADIRFTGVRTHNLQIPEVVIPAGRFTIVTGVSGSGKSSLAFETLYGEARNRFTESFSPYARRFLEKPGEAEFESVTGLTPAVAVRQRIPSRNPRSTVGTMTEIADYYRLLFSRAGEYPCPSCGGAAGADASPCPACGWRRPVAMMSTAFSPNAEQGACPDCKGLGEVAECDPERLVTHPERPLLDGAMDGHRTGRFYGERQGQHMAILRAVGSGLGIDFGIQWAALDERDRDVAMQGAGEREFDVEWHYRRGSREGVHRFRSKWIGLAGYVGQEYLRKHADRRGEALEPLMRRVRCRACGGARLKPEALGVRIAGSNIAELQRLTVTESLAFFDGWRPSARAAALGADIRHEVVARLERLRDGGIGYLSIDRPASTLSAGEAQRVRLATEVSTGLTGITYVLDEPTAGLHARDTARLLRLVAGLRDAGNTVVVVEHDLDVVRSADHVIELGPGAGAMGGRVVASGTPAEMAVNQEAPTGRAMARRVAGVLGARAGGGPSPARRLRPGVSLRHATRNNLRDLSVDIPAGGLVAVTGVSGSGKSTLVFDVLAPAMKATLASPAPQAAVGGLAAPAAGLAITVHEPFERVVVAARDLLPASPSSTPATVTGAWDAIRAAFASTASARALGLTARHFSTNVKGGRCEACEGAGRIRVSMDFLPDVWVGCEACDGRRYSPAALECRLAGRSIADVLEMSVAEARRFFSSQAGVAPVLGLLEEVGLGYLRLGQGADTLSGGERQRLALAADIGGGAAGPFLYLFDEPTTGLHPEDVVRLMAVLDRLIGAGHSVIVVEHDLDVVAAADYVVDLGPEGGDGGGRLVAAGTPLEVARTADSWTGRALLSRAGGRSERGA
jgi:excinuclease ABC subunit A